MSATNTDAAFDGVSNVITTTSGIDSRALRGIE